MGNNAVFNRSWRFCAEWTDRDTTTAGLNASGELDDLLYMIVDVQWRDLATNELQTVSLDSNITWKNVRATVSLSRIPAEPLIPSATGRAYLGDGHVDPNSLQNNPDAVNNGDGTVTLYKANADGSDVALIDADTGEIVLTLEDACKTQNAADCYEFVKIRGRVYFNRGRNTEKGSGLDASSVYVLASDAAYCARVFDTDGAPFKVADANGDTKIDYEYYDYTCYLGGGWYGNIGLLLTGNGVSENDRVCVGDPNAAVGVGAWKEKELAKRRVYRGMLYERDPNNYNEWVVDHAGNTAAVDDLAHPPLYYSKGVADGVEYPDYVKYKNGDLVWVYVLSDGTESTIFPRDGRGLPKYPGRDGSHDYVVMNSTGQADADDCTIPLTRPDSAVADISVPPDGVNDVGTLFSNVPADFVCLNDEYLPEVPLYLAHYPPAAQALYDPTGFDPARDKENDPIFRSYPYLDYFNGQTIDSSGHVDPVYPDLTVYGAEDYCPWDPSRPPSYMWLIKGTIFNVTASGAYDLAGTNIYTSDGADDCWFVDAVGNIVTNPSGTSLNYVCRVFEWGDGWNGSVVLDPIPTVACSSTSHSYSTLAADTATSAEDFSCENRQMVTITGSMTAYMNDVGELAGTSVVAVGLDASGNDEVPVSCTVTPDHGTIASFTCQVYEQAIGSGWKGEIRATMPDGISCDTTTRLYDPAISTDDVAFNTHCSGPVTTLTLNGQITADASMDGLALPTVTATDMVSCTAPVLVAADPTIAEYSCEVNFNYLTGWNGTVTIDTSTSPAMTCSPLTITPGAVTSNYTIPTSPACTVDQSGDVHFAGVIYDLIAPNTDYHIHIEYTDINGDGSYWDYGVLRNSSGAIDGDCQFYWQPNFRDIRYTCDTATTLAPGQKWSGSLEIFPKAGNIMCNPIVNFNNLRPNQTVTQDFAASPDTATCTANGY